ncbi:hypothetical protein [Clostridium magnum]|uniref:hypothetical protein n=1 Tax=Clostridium magnum TaxID=33954 RepID=UPI0008355EBE|nr:hypothetical protein [Clostridium magnum]
MEQFYIYIDEAFADFYKEWSSGNFRKYSECHSYHELRTLLDSVNPLRKYMGWKALSIKEMIEYRES